MKQAEHDVKELVGVKRFSSHSCEGQATRDEARMKPATGVGLRGGQPANIVERSPTARIAMTRRPALGHRIVSLLILLLLPL